MNPYRAGMILSKGDMVITALGFQHRLDEIKH